MKYVQFRKDKKCIITIGILLGILIMLHLILKPWLIEYQQKTYTVGYTLLYMFSAVPATYYF